MKIIRRSFSFHGREGGFTLIELLFVIAALGLLSVMTLTEKLRDIADDEAAMLGVQLIQFESAVASYLFKEGGGVAIGQYTGVDWLKATTCGGTSTQGYLPCSFPINLNFGLGMVTDISSSQVGFSAITKFGTAVLQWRGEDNELLAAQAIRHANTLSSAGVGDITLSNFLTFSRSTSGVRGIIIGTVESALSAAPYIRIDGTNSPVAAIDWDNQNLVNVREIRAKSIYDTTKQRSLSQAVQDIGIYSDGDKIPKPICPIGESPEIFLSPMSFAVGSTSDNIQGVLTRAIHYSPTQWELELRIVTPTATVTPDPGYGLVTAFTKCT